VSFDLDRLVKVLGMTGSSHDAEALSALRKAQKIMAEAKVSWGDILHAPTTGGSQYLNNWGNSPWAKAREAEMNAYEQAEMQRKYNEAIRRAEEVRKRNPDYHYDSDMKDRSKKP
jgi:N-methylhydantoinase B/oxoprolinase/acetone carboxylase alpha subunit